MARLECRSSQPNIPSKWVDVENITDEEVARARSRLDELLKANEQISTAVATAFLEVTTSCPAANPSDLWQHVIYRHLLEHGWSDQRWKRVSGFALERALVALYQARLLSHRIRMRILAASEANTLLAKLGITETKATKVDLFLEGKKGRNWLTLGVAHGNSTVFSPSTSVPRRAPSRLSLASASTPCLYTRNRRISLCAFSLNTEPINWAGVSDLQSSAKAVRHLAHLRIQF